jgi:hypothetical protein
LETLIGLLEQEFDPLILQQFAINPATARII